MHILHNLVGNPADLAAKGAHQVVRHTQHVNILQSLRTLNKRARKNSGKILEPVKICFLFYLTHLLNSFFLQEKKSSKLKIRA